MESIVRGLLVAPAVLTARWFVDVEDTALLHIAALTIDGVESERIFAAAGPYSWAGILDIMHKRYPQRKSILQAVDEKAFNAKEVDNSRSIALLQRLGKEGFTSLEDTIAKAVDTVIQCDGKEVPKSWLDLMLGSVATQPAGVGERG